MVSAEGHDGAGSTAEAKREMSPRRNDLVELETSKNERNATEDQPNPATTNH